MKKIAISGYGYSLPKSKLEFGDKTRYRLPYETPEDFWSLVTDAVDQAFSKANCSIADIDCIVAAMATPLQPIPCNAALIHEHIAMGKDIPAFDINSTCTSFITALDIVSCLVDAGRYKRVLVVSGDIASQALNTQKKESYELFSDVCTAFVLEETRQDIGVIYAKQKTWSEGAHHTEIPRGGSLSSGFKMNEANRAEYYFTMDGFKTVMLTIDKIKPFLAECFEACGVCAEDVAMVVPHQASEILTVFMKKIGFPKGKYIDIVSQYGNMVSGSVPFALCKAMEEKTIKAGDKVLLVGTAAGLTINFLLLGL